MAASTVVYFLIPLAVVTILYMRIGQPLFANWLFM
jgi:hypothetical protein